MKQTTNYLMHLPEVSDYVDIDVLDENTVKIDGELKKAETHRGEGTRHVTPAEKARWDGKAERQHTHPAGDITGLDAAIAGKADKRVPAAAGNLAALDAAGNLTDTGKKPGDFAPTAHTHSKSEIPDFAHSHSKVEITDFAHSHSTGDITAGTLPLARGGTGAGTAAGARGNLGAAQTLPLVAVTLLTSGWSASGGNQVQTIVCPGLLTTDDEHTRVHPAPSTDSAAQKLTDEAYGLIDYFACNTNGQLYARCGGDKPTINVPLLVEMNRGF